MTAALVVWRLQSALPGRQVCSSRFHLVGTSLPLRLFERRLWDLQKELQRGLPVPLESTTRSPLERLSVSKLVSLESCLRRTATSRASHNGRTLALATAPGIG